MLLICGVGIVGMIATSIADSTSGALTFGLVTAGAVGALFVANFVARDSACSMTEEALISRIEADTAGLVDRDLERLHRISRDSFELGRRDAPAS